MTAPIDRFTWTDKVVGTLLGAAVGDAVGRIFEGTATVNARGVDGVLAAGALTWTDDTAMTLTLARYLVQLPDPLHLDPAELARWHAHEWYQEPWRGYGSAPPKIFRAVLAGEDWARASARVYGDAGSLGNGAAMRAAPIGALRLSPAQTEDLARTAASITHAHEEGQDGAAAIALASRWCLASPPPHDTSLEGRRAWASDLVEHLVARMRTHPMRTVLHRVVDTLDIAEPRDAARRTGNGTTAVRSVPAALAAFLREPTDPVAVIDFAVRMGGDTDTIASMAGALAGGVAGASAIPRDLQRRLEGIDHIRRLGVALAGVAPNSRVAADRTTPQDEVDARDRDAAQPDHR